ncbi:MAG TPA: prolipoprotein diacylglyceryl transferase [Rhodothermales bacterium]
MNAGSLPDRYWVHDLDPFVVKFTETIGIRYYGLSYMLGFLAGFVLLHLASKRGRSPLTVAQNADYLFAIVIGVLAGGRLGYFLLYEPESFLRPLTVLKVWAGGMASHGGFIGVLLAMMWFARSRKVSFWQLADLTCMITPPGLFFGRIANFINGELWGRVSEVRWAVIFPGSAPAGTPLERIQPRHPSQLYEAGLEGALLFAFVALRYWRGKTREIAPGRIVGEFLTVYAVLRIIGEIFREPDATPLFGMSISRGIFYSIVMGVAGIAIAVLAERRARVADTDS